MSLFLTFAYSVGAWLLVFLLLKAVEVRRLPSSSHVQR